MRGGIADEGAPKEAGGPPYDHYAGKHPDGDAETAGDKNVVEEDKHG